MMRKFHRGFLAAGLSATSTTTSLRFQSGAAPTTGAAPITSNPVDEEPQVVESISSVEQAEIKAFQLKQQQKLEKAERTRKLIKKLWDSPKTALYGSALPTVARTVAPWCGTSTAALKALTAHAPKNSLSKATGFSVWMSVRQAERFQQGAVALDLAEYTVEAPSTLKQAVKNKRVELWEKTMRLRRDVLHKKTNETENRDLYGGADEIKMMVKYSQNLGKGLLKNVDDSSPIVQSARAHTVDLKAGMKVTKIAEGIVKINDTVFVHQSTLPDPALVDFFFANGFGPGDISYDAITGKILPLDAQREIHAARKERLPRISRHVRGQWFPIQGVKSKMESVGVTHARSLWIKESDFDAANLKFDAEIDDRDEKRQITLSNGDVYFHLSKVRDGCDVLYNLSTKTHPYPMMHSLRHTSLSAYSGQPKVPFWIDGSPVPPNQAKRMLAAADADGVSLKKTGNWWAREQPANIKAEEHVAAKRKIEEYPRRANLWKNQSAEYSAAMWNKDLPTKEDLAMHKTKRVTLPITFKNINHSFNVYPIEFADMQPQGNLRAAPKDVPEELAYMSSTLLNSAQIEYKMPFRAMGKKVESVMRAIRQGKGKHPCGDVVALTTNGDFAYSPEKGVLVHWGRLVKDLREFKQSVEANNATVPHGTLNPGSLDIDLILDNIRFLSKATEKFTKKISDSNIAYNAWTGDMLPAADQEALREWCAKDGNKLPDCTSHPQLKKYFPAEAATKPNVSLWVHELQVAQFAWMLAEGAELPTAVNGYYHLTSLSKAGEILTDLSFKTQPWPLFKFLRIDCQSLPAYHQPKYVRNALDDTPIIPMIARQIQAFMTKNRDSVIKNMQWALVPVPNNKTPPEDAVPFLDGHMRSRYYIEGHHPNVSKGVYVFDKYHHRASVNAFRDVKTDEVTRLRGFSKYQFHRVSASDAPAEDSAAAAEKSK